MVINTYYRDLLIRSAFAMGIIINLTTCFASDQPITLRLDLKGDIEIEAGELKVETIPIRNVGSEDFDIDHIATSCGCSQASLTPRVLKAGQSGSLSCSFNAIGRTGNFAIKLVAVTRGGQNIAVADTIKLTAYRDVDMSQLVELGEVDAGQQVSSSLDILATDNVETSPAVSIADLLPEQGGAAKISFVVGQLPPAIGSTPDSRVGIVARAFQAQLTAVAPQQPGEFTWTTEITIRHLRGSERTFPIRVHGEVRSPLAAVPDRFLIGSMREGEKRSISLQLVSSPAGSFVVEDVAGADPSIKVVHFLTQRSDDGSTSLRVDLELAKASAGIMSNHLHIRAVQREKEITTDVPITLLCQ